MFFGRRGRGPSPAVVAALLGLALAVAGHTASHSGHEGHGRGARAAVPAGPVSSGSNVGLGEQMAAAEGWTGGQWDCLDWLWTRESGWNQYADTRASGLDPAGAAVFAYGIPQARPASKMPLAAQPASDGGSSDPAAQIRWGLSYIAATYGTPCAAWAHEEANSWY
jgi:hypothetical protein